MINAEKLTFGFNSNPLFQDISFTLEENCHCVLIGSNGTGKTTLTNLIRDPERYTFEGKLKLEGVGRIGYVSQFAARDGDQSVTVYDYLRQDFLALEQAIHDVCSQMETAEEMDALMERNPRCTVQDVIDELLTIREYQEALEGQQPEVWVGSKDSFAGRIYVEMYGVGAPTLDEYIACSNAGVGTFVVMHATPEVVEVMRKHNKSNIIVAGHMASDSLGFNQILEAWEAKGIEVVRISGIV